MINRSRELYPNYRQQTTKNIIKFLLTGESFRVTGKSGVGKSKYLRFLAHHNVIKKEYLDPNNIEIYYTDLNRIYKKDIKQLCTEISKELRLEDTKLPALEKFIQKKSEKGKIVYIIIDHSELLQDFGDSTVKIIRSVRDKFKYTLGFIFSYENGIEINKTKMKELLDISPVEIEIENLTPLETKENIEFYAKDLGVDISENEMVKMVEASNGFPKYIKQFLSYKIANINIDKAIINIQNLNRGIDKNDDYFLEKAIKNMTKAEYMFFEEMYHRKDKVIVRDRFAELLSPGSNGEGVSNEAIDQVISRLRKKLKNLIFPFKVKTQRGIGYYME
jgi:hypothetical protein